MGPLRGARLAEEGCTEVRDKCVTILKDICILLLGEFQFLPNVLFFAPLRS